MKYFSELSKSMEFLAKNKKTVFLGQAVEYPGTGMSNTLSKVSKNKLYEMPVTEEMQLGMSIGMALNGFIPISIYPRWNFLLLAANQLVNHLDKLNEISNGKYNPKVIIRTSIGSERPLHPQAQHVGDYSEAFEKMLCNIEIVKLKEPSHILPAYKRAIKINKSSILVEYGDYYNEK